MRLLVVKLSALGDVIHALQALGRVRAVAPPGLVVDWAVDPRNAPLLTGHPWLEQVHALDLKGWVGRGEWRRSWEAVRRLRRIRYDAVADLQGLFKSGLVARLAGARRRVGYVRGEDLGPWREAPRATGDPRLVVDPGPPAGALHVVDEYARLLAAAVGVPARPASSPGSGAEAADPPPPLFPVDPEERAALDAWLASAGVEPAEPLALVLPGGGWPTKLLPIESLVAVAARLAAGGLRPLILWGSEAERGMAEAVAAGVAAARPAAAGAARPAGPAVVVPRLPLRQLAALGARVAVAVGGDTGPLHLAAVQGAATASFYGPTAGARSGPRGPRHRVLQAVVDCGPCFGRRCRTGRFVCLPGIDPAAIAAEALAALGVAQAPGRSRA